MVLAFGRLKSISYLCESVSIRGKSSSSAASLRLSASRQYLCELSKLFQAHLFGAGFWRELQLLKCGSQCLFRPILSKQFQHHLSTLRKAALDDFHEERFLPHCEQRLRTP